MPVKSANYTTNVQETFVIILQGFMLIKAILEFELILQDNNVIR